MQVPKCAGKTHKAFGYEIKVFWFRVSLLLMAPLLGLMSYAMLSPTPERAKLQDSGIFVEEFSMNELSQVVEKESPRHTPVYRIGPENKAVDRPEQRPQEVKPTVSSVHPNARGMTWVMRRQVGDFCNVGADRSTNAYSGDTAAKECLPILAIKVTNEAAPSGLTFNFYNGWSRGELKLTKPILGTRLSSLEETNRIVREELGEGWRIAEHHDGGGGWHIWGRGKIPAGTRFWAHINDQSGNPWNSH